MPRVIGGLQRRWFCDRL